MLVPPDDAERAFGGFPTGVVWTADDVAIAVRDEQVRLWWDETPVDVFFAGHAFHLAAGRRAVTVDFLGRPIRVLAPEDLATFEVLFDRPKDWVDIATMLDNGTLDLDAVIDAVGDLLGDDDDRVGRLRAMPR